MKEYQRATQMAEQGTVLTGKNTLVLQTTEHHSIYMLKGKQCVLRIQLGLFK